MHEWHRILSKVSRYGVDRPDRTGTGTRALFGELLEFTNDDREFPAVTSKHLGWKQCMAELECFIKGHNNLKQFHEAGCTIWDANANAQYWSPRWPGDLGKIYGFQWRHFSGRSQSGGLKQVDQLKELVGGLKRDPYGRRHLVTAWNPAELDQMCLPPCHYAFQCFVSDGCMDLLVHMRSVDLFLGLPFDIASYAVLQRLIATETGLKSRFLKFSLGDAHIYDNHKAQVAEVVSRPTHVAPTLELSGTLFNFKGSDAKLVGYSHAGAVPAQMNV